MTEQKIYNIACSIKEYLIALAVDDKLPMDMGELDERAIASIITKNVPTAKDMAIESAEHYLSDSELSIKDQVEAIAAHAEENGNDWIDDVEGVLVWEPLEHRFDCDEFLQMIGWDLTK